MLFVKSCMFLAIFLNFIGKGKYASGKRLFAFFTKYFTIRFRKVGIVFKMRFFNKSRTIIHAIFSHQIDFIFKKLKAITWIVIATAINQSVPCYSQSPHLFDRGLYWGWWKKLFSLLSFWLFSLKLVNHRYKIALDL